MINNIKVDFIRHSYPWISDPLVFENVNMASDYDIAAMKLNAIANSGQRAKDFYDVYFFLERFSLLQMIEAFEEKYKPANGAIAAKAIGYFGDIDPDGEPVFLVKKMKFERVQARIEEALFKPAKIFK